MIASSLVLGCRSGARDAPAPAPSLAASAVAASSGPRQQPAKRNWPLASGPLLAILAGRGVGPIRLGASVATVERHMALPCEVKTPDACRYIARGVEFRLENGNVKTIHVQRAGRPAGKDASGKEAEYGFFHGAIPPDLQLGMVPDAIKEHLGAPVRAERHDQPGTANNVEVHYYDGMRLEYDRLENGNLVVGGVVIEKQAPGAPAGSATLTE